MNAYLVKKLKQLPSKPGVYFHKNSTGEIIYIGKAANLNNRVRQYFHNSRQSDPKTDALVSEINDIEWTEVETELDALFLEAELIRRYMPQYNILLRDDKSLVYVRINSKNPHPTVTLTRRPLDDGAQYFGPYFSSITVRKALKYLRKIFPYSTHTQVPKRACLQYHLGLCPGLEENKTNIIIYRNNLKKLSKYLKGERSKLINDLNREMKLLSRQQKFEEAAIVRNQMTALTRLKQQIIFGDKEIQDISKDQGLVELSKILGLENPPNLIEGYDISHMSGTNNVASQVVFRAGVPNKSAYRKYKMNLKGNNDYAHMYETVNRRLSEKNLAKWPKPDLILIDGGKGQLDAAIKASQHRGVNVPMIGLAKKYETVIVNTKNSQVKVDEKYVKNIDGFINKNEKYVEIELSKSSNSLKLLQRVRDESHRFAVSYHSVLKTKQQTKGWLDSVPSIGPSSRKKLLKTFGSVRGVMQARQSELDKTIGPAKAKILKQYIRAESKDPNLI